MTPQRPSFLPPLSCQACLAEVCSCTDNQHRLRVWSLRTSSPSPSAGRGPVFECPGYTSSFTQMRKAQLWLLRRDRIGLGLKEEFLSALTAPTPKYAALLWDR